MIRSIRFVKWVLGSLAMSGTLLAPGAATAQLHLDISIPWGVNEFHSVNAARFAERVKEETGGEIVMKTHAGGTLGIKASESLRAIGEGVVPMGEFALFQNAGRAPVLAIETLPFLVSSYDELAVMHESFRPLWEQALEKSNQKALYIVPWPQQLFFLTRPVSTLGDLKGLKMRSLDKLTSDWITRLGMLPVQMTNLEILQALGSGMIEGIPTSAGTAVAQKYWDFTKYAYVTNHIWASNVMSINMDVWNKIPPQHQETILRVAREMEPEFWQTSMQDHDKKVAELEANGMTVDSNPESLVVDMQAITKALWDDYMKPMGAEAATALDEYRAEIER